MANFSQDVVAKAREFDRESAALKTRVHQLAKSLGLTSKETIEALGHAGIVVKSAASTINQNQLDAVLNFIVDQAEDSSLDDGSAAAEPKSKKSDSTKTDSTKTDSAKTEDIQADKQAEKPAKKSAKKAAKKTSKKSAKAEKSDKAEKKQAKKSDKSAAEDKSGDDSKPTTKKRASRKRAVKKSTEATAAMAEANAAAESDDAQKGKQFQKNEKPQKSQQAQNDSVSANKDSAVEAALEATADSAAEAAEQPTADGAAVESETKENSAGDDQSRRTRRGRRVRRAVRTTSDLEAVQEDAHKSAFDADADDNGDTALSDIEPPAVPEPPAADEQTTYAPIFLAPKAVSAQSAQSAQVATHSSDEDYQDYDDKDASSEKDADDKAGEKSRKTSSSNGGVDVNRQPRPRRRRRGRGRRNEEPQQQTEQTQDDVEQVEEPQAIKGSTRLEAQRRRRIERREESRKRHVISEAEFLARRESVERTMVVRERKRHDHAGVVTEVGVLEDDLLVEHFVTSDTQTTQIGNIYLGRVQNVLPSMEAAFIDIGTDRNGVIYVGDLNWKLMGVKSRSRKIEHALKAGDQILVQVSKDPIGHKGARLTTHISLAGRFLVYVPGGRSAGISRKLPEPERKRLKSILSDVTPEGSGTIIRTAAEGVSKEAIEADIKRLESQWQEIWEASEEAKAKRGAKPITLYQEPDMLVKVVRDVFNEDFSRLVVEGDRPWNTVTDYIGDLAPELEPRLQRYFAKEHGGVDVFEHFRIDEQLAKALDRKVWLPSGGTLVIDRTEAMTVIDVNTGKFTGSGGNLEETVTRNNLEAAEEIVRQMRLRDLGGMIVVDFIDMVLPENQDLVLRRLKEALGRDRSRHEVSEVTSLGLVQMTRKRLGTGLLETFSTPCTCCNGRGLIIHIDPVEHDNNGRGSKQGKSKRRGMSQHEQDPKNHPAALAMHRGKGEEDSAKSSRDDEPSASQREKDEADKRVAAAVEAVIVSSENDEPKPPRRRGRKNQNAKRQETKRQESSESSDDLAALAAAAVAEAREKDPEEPSDDRYVPHGGHRRRRATRRRVAEHVAVDTAAHESADSDSEKFAERGERQGRGDRSERTAGGSGRRRRRRATRRSIAHSGSEPREAAESQKAERKAEQKTQQGAKDSKSGNAGQSGNTGNAAQTYEEAKEAFENSPRRRRPTRGNSRSDYAPRREDFEATAAAKSERNAESRAAEAKVSGRAGGEQEQPRAQIMTVRGSGARRNRRRAVRRVTSVSDNGNVAPKNAPKSGSKTSSKATETQAPRTQTRPSNRRRRTRRAVRRSGRS
ncbi:MAG: translation initiation factor IF-2 N-terminal domain-containing protein [Corynebacterium sp.]|uniref:translation initiation factor IF-2 N-terminal domain-containing protein n=1 Tax=Corynebacterium sp. TaxID=1720 RepID=UPI0026DC6F66|nr:translation initiation factor IF-2 N-terminal domain-containing protein [Corynebacterium sp.]MDO5030972.1 translation initiation factor IF-2 N-terminal domain-containing protein [Corynebacterium sp.]